MKARTFAPKLLIFVVSVLFLMSCLLPGMIPLESEPSGSMPVMEKDADTLLEVLQGEDWVFLQALAEEQYTEEDFAGPGTLTFTVKITNNTPTYFNYGWCTTTEEILAQNFEHITVQFYFNDDKLGRDVVHPITFTRPDGLLCLDFGVLISEWPAGDYNLEAIATFDQKINDGLADYEAGDYIFKYNVIVEK
jgi:hypothetical protein